MSGYTITLTDREYDALKDRIRTLESAINWALGASGDFAQRRAGQGAYWWRTELRQRAGLTFHPPGATAYTGDVADSDDVPRGSGQETACESSWAITKKQAIEPTAEAADAFWKYWRENGDTHKHGYYESTWGAINAALNASAPKTKGEQT